MKFIFFFLVLASVIGINYYVFIRGWQILPPFLWVKYFYVILFWGLVASFFIRMFFGDNFSPQLSTLLSAAGFTWFIAVIYFALIALGVDLVRLLNYIFDFWPALIKDNLRSAAQITAAISISLVSIVLIYGNYKFNNPVITRLDIPISKPLPNGELRIVLMSDIHLSSYITGKDLDKYISLANSQSPDIVMITGDIADRDLAPLKEWNVAERFLKLKAKYGVYAVSGNHEFYGGQREQIYRYLRTAGMTLLLDSVAVAGGAIQIAGREDRTKSNRMSLNSLLSGLDRSLPLILLDHQPYNLDEAQREGVDLQLSGHTHNGQFWPVNLIVKLMYELSYGYKRKGDTHYYVTSGVGLWGPRIRIGTKSEIVVIDLKSSLR
jgi:predicted MPP superfamily phosphohydrolase